MGVQWRGFVAATLSDGSICVLLAGSVVDEWRKHTAVLEAVLDGVQFTDHLQGRKAPNWVWDGSVAESNQMAAPEEQSRED